MNRALVILLAAISVLGCNRKDAASSLKTYHLEKAYDKEDKVFLNDMCSEVKTVPLEASDTVIIGVIKDIHLYNNELYVIHETKCSVFDLNGNYLRHIGRKGNGPGEYLAISSVFFNDNAVFIYDFFRNALLTYSTDGRFIKKVDVGDYFMDFKFIDDMLIACYYVQGGEDNRRMMFINAEGKRIDSMLHFRKKNLNGVYTIHDFDGRFFRYQNSCYLKEGFNDTVFRITPERTLLPQYIVDPGKDALTFDDRFTLSDAKSAVSKKSATVIFENGAYIILKDNTLSKYEYILIDKTRDTAGKVRFCYDEKMLRNFTKAKKLFYPSSVPDIIPADKNTEPTVVDDGSPCFRILNVSDDSKTWIGVESPLDPDDNPVVVLARISD